MTAPPRFCYNATSARNGRIWRFVNRAIESRARSGPMFQPPAGRFPAPIAPPAWNVRRLHDYDHQKLRRLVLAVPVKVWACLITAGCLALTLIGLHQALHLVRITDSEGASQVVMTHLDDPQKLMQLSASWPKRATMCTTLPTTAIRPA